MSSLLLPLYTVVSILTRYLSLSTAVILDKIAIYVFCVQIYFFGKERTQISEALLKNDVDDQITLNTIMYELLHTVPGCFAYKGKLKLYADYINKKLPQYTIKRLAKESEVNLKIERKQPVYKYILCCTKCGQEIKRQKESKVVTNYKRYRCGKCGGRLERVL